MSAESETPQQPLSIVAQTWSLSVLVGTTMCFIIGLFITNAHLARHGVFSMSFIRTDYILAGTLFLFCVVVSTFCLEEGMRMYRIARARWLEKRRGNAIIGFALAPLTLVIVPSSILLNAAGTKMSISTGIFALFIFCFIGSILRSFGVQYVAIWRRFRRDGKEVAVRTQDISSLINALPIFIGLTALYAIAIYPDLSAAIGGGRRTPVFLVVDDRGMQIAVSLGMPVGTDLRIGPLDPLMESDSEMIFLVPGEANVSQTRTVRLQRRLVEAVVSAQ